eukprot:Em0012g603a
MSSRGRRTLLANTTPERAAMSRIREVYQKLATDEEQQLKLDKEIESEHNQKIVSLVANEFENRQFAIIKDVDSSCCDTEISSKRQKKKRVDGEPLPNSAPSNAEPWMLALLIVLYFYGCCWMSKVLCLLGISVEQVPAVGRELKHDGTNKSISTRDKSRMKLVRGDRCLKDYGLRLSQAADSAKRFNSNWSKTKTRSLEVTLNQYLGTAVLSTMVFEYFVFGVVPLICAKKIFITKRMQRVGGERTGLRKVKTQITIVHGSSKCVTLMKFKVFHVYSVALRTLPISHRISTLFVQGWGNYNSWSSLDRFCWLNVRFIITVKKTQICTNRSVAINLFCKNIVFWTLSMVVNIRYYTRLEPVKMNDRRFIPPTMKACDFKRGLTQSFHDLKRSFARVMQLSGSTTRNGCRVQPHRFAWAKWLPMDFVVVYSSFCLLCSA